MKTCIALAILCLSVPSARAEEAGEDFRVLETIGEVAVIPAGGTVASPAKAGLPLAPGDRIETGKTGRVELAAKSGTVIRLDANSALGIEDLRTGWVRFKLSVGRLLARFERSKISKYKVTTPVAVASVRGTELAIEVAEDGSIEAGVIEGEVAFESTAERESESDPAPETWPAEVVTSSQGVSIPVDQKPMRMNEIPKPLVATLDWFPAVRARVPRLRETWKDLDPPSRRRLRQQALRDRIQWKSPLRQRDRLTSPRDRVKPRAIERRRRAPSAPQDR